MFILSRNISEKSKKELLIQTGVEPICKIVNGVKCNFYPKKNLPTSDIFLQLDKNWIFGMGTWVYNSKFGEESLKLILYHLINNSLKEDQWRGQFIFIAYLDGQLKLFADPSGIMNIYYDKKGSVSSSFLALMRNTSTAFKFNKLAGMEVLSTGNLISPDTLVTGINRWHPRSKIYRFGEIKLNIVNSSLLLIENIYKSREHALDQHLELMNELMVDFSMLQLANRTDFGITGGLDSRLLLGFALKNWKRDNIKLYTNSRIRNSGAKIVDEPVAKYVADSLNMPIKYGWMRHPSDLDDITLNTIINRSYHFSDGHVRMQIQFFEEFHTASFKQRLLNGSTFNLSGIGGEQYRNQEGISGTFDSRSFIKYKSILFTSGNILGSELDNVVDYINGKAQNRISSHLGKWSIIEVKKYYNEVLNSERLGARNNMENKLGWFFSPFAEAKVAMHAYSLCPFLKKVPDFQLDLLNIVSPSLANVFLDYGFIPKKGIPFTYGIKEQLKFSIPWKLFYQLRLKQKFKKANYLYEQIRKKEPISSALDILKEVFPQLIIQEALARPDTMPIAINLGIFLKKEIKEGTLDI